MFVAIQLIISEPTHALFTYGLQPIL